MNINVKCSFFGKLVNLCEIKLEHILHNMTPWKHFCFSLDYALYDRYAFLKAHDNTKYDTVRTFLIKCSLSNKDIGI